MENESIKKVLIAVNELTDIFVEANDDGKITVKDITLIPETLTLVKTLADNWVAAKTELANLDEATAHLIAGNLIHAFFKVK
jgi:propanediol dehydratase small subunit